MKFVLCSTQDDMNLTEQKKAPLRERDASFKRSMLTMSYKGGKVHCHTIRPCTNVECNITVYILMIVFEWLFTYQKCVTVKTSKIEDIGNRTLWPTFGAGKPNVFLFLWMMMNKWCCKIHGVSTPFRHYQIQNFIEHLLDNEEF